jgi:hypothetical protein
MSKLHGAGERHVVVTRRHTDFAGIANSSVGDLGGGRTIRRPIEEIRGRSRKCAGERAPGDRSAGSVCSTMSAALWVWRPPWSCEPGPPSRQPASQRIGGESRLANTSSARIRGTAAACERSGAAWKCCSQGLYLSTPAYRMGGARWPASSHAQKNRRGPARYRCEATPA